MRVSSILSDQLHRAWVHKTVQDVSTTGQRRCKTALRMLQKGPKTVQDSPRTAQERSKTAQYCVKTVPSGRFALQDVVCIVFALVLVETCSFGEHVLGAEPCVFLYLFGIAALRGRCVTRFQMRVKTIRTLCGKRSFGAFRR